METTRADSFLRMIRRAQRGRLKIYLGYCAGVGKTYEMLQEAQRLKNEGIDVVVGLVETHGRRETDALVEGLETIPRRKITYRGIDIEEMDLEAILTRRPAVVLVDELAHTNVPGSKNAKRYQDVDDLRAAGIHVISTLNVQHLESLFDTVERNTGVKVRERIPDRVVLEADQLVNVDVTTEDLRTRLREGKVYTRERVELALENFFRESNLEQLRELTLRELAAQLDSRRRDVVSDETQPSPDQVMVCLSSRGPNGEALLRYGSRLAGKLNRNWYAVYVQTTAESPTNIDAATQRNLSNTLALAQQLGATVFTYKGDDIVGTILQFAKEYRVGHIVLGTPGRKPPFWRRLAGDVGLVSRLLHEARGLNIVVVDTQVPSAPRVASSPPATEAGVSVVPVRVTDYMTSNAIRIWRGPRRKQGILPELVDACLPDVGPAVRASALDAILAREGQGSTFLGLDVAIPHARVTGLERLRIAIGIAPDGVTDPEIDAVVRVVFLMLSPAGENNLHLRMLAVAAKLAQDTRVLNLLTQSTDSETVYEHLLDWEQSRTPT